jgi:hypothetical protein
MKISRNISCKHICKLTQKEQTDYEISYKILKERTQELILKEKHKILKIYN